MQRWGLPRSSALHDRLREQTARDHAYAPEHWQPHARWGQAPRSAWTVESSAVLLGAGPCVSQISSRQPRVPAREPRQAAAPRPARGLGELLHRASRPAMLAEDAGPKHERPLGRTGELCPTEQGSQPACHAARVLSVALPFGYLHRPLARPAEDRELRRGKARRFAGSCRGSAIVSDLHGSSAIFLPRNSCKLRLGNFTPGHGSTGELMSPLPRILPRGAGTADARRAYRAKTDAMSASV